MGLSLKSITKGLKKAWDDLRGKTDERKANALLAQEADRQAGVRQGMSDYLDEIQTGLAQQKQNYLNAVNNANSIESAYLNNYLASIRNLADTNYNPGVTALHRDIANAENNIRNQMANRGISGAGVDFRNLVNSQGALARGISALQAQRQRDMADVAEANFNAGRNVNNANWSRLNSYYNYNPQMSQAQAYKYGLMSGNLQPSEYTQARIAQHQEKASNPALTKLISAGVNAMAGNWLGAAGSLLGNNSGTNWLGAAGNLFGGKSNGSSTGTSVFGNSGYNNSYLNLGSTPYYSPYSDVNYLDNMNFGYKTF